MLSRPLGPDCHRSFSRTRWTGWISCAATSSSVKTRAARQATHAL